MRKQDFYLQVAIGFRDLAGTGFIFFRIFSFTKQIGNFDFTFGLGWGNLGSADNIGNPLKSLDEGFENRNFDVGQGGSFSLKSWFSGSSSMLGGIEYDLKKYGIRLKLEYDTTNPDKLNLSQKI